MIEDAAAVATGYLLGSLPFGYWAGRLRGIDLRREGSGNTGATNALRVLGARWGVSVMALDVGKGSAAVLIADHVGGTNVAVLAAVAAVLGHAFPLFLGFRGGKAVATGAGTMLAMVPPIGVAAFGIWVGVGLLTRYISLGSLSAAVSFPVMCAAFGEPWPVTLYTLAACAFVFWRHRANIARLRAGTENRLTLRRAAPPAA
ncbi:MAG: glycerol-3-phosphate 1-O-acyltransferase PlsY [Gaiellales bacterium]